MPLTRNERDLVGDQLEHAGGQDARQQGLAPADGAGVGEESTKRDDGRNRGEADPRRQGVGNNPITRDAYVRAYRGDVAALAQSFPEIDLTLWPNFAHLADDAGC